MANDNDSLLFLPIIKNKTIATSGIFTSEAIDIQALKLRGDITLQVEVTGDGTCKFEFSQSNNFIANGPNAGGDFQKPVDGFAILDSFTKTSGTDSDGKDVANVSMFNSQAFKIICTETGGADSVTVDAWLSMQ